MQWPHFSPSLRHNNLFSLDDVQFDTDIQSVHGGEETRCGVCKLIEYKCDLSSCNLT